MTVALELTANKQHAKIHFDFCINGHLCLKNE